MDGIGCVFTFVSTSCWISKINKRGVPSFAYYFASSFFSSESTRPHHSSILAHLPSWNPVLSLEFEMFLTKKTLFETGNYLSSAPEKIAGIFRFIHHFQSFLYHLYKFFPSIRGKTRKSEPTWLQCWISIDLRLDLFCFFFIPTLQT